MLAQNFQKAGYNVIINGYINQPAWENIQKQVGLTHKVLLLPHVDEVKLRDTDRQDGYSMGIKAVERHHDHFSNESFYNDFIKLDSSGQTIDETLRFIKTLL